MNSSKGGEQRTRVAYQTGGITWWADYNLVWEEGSDANSGQLDLSAWVSIINMSGASYPEAKLKLIAGDVHRAEQPQVVGRMVQAMAKGRRRRPTVLRRKSSSSSISIRSGRRTTLPNNSTKQIELFDQARKIPAKNSWFTTACHRASAFGSPYTERELGTPMNTKIDVYLEFKNEKQYGLGVPLPAGRIRVSKLDGADGSMEFVGEDASTTHPKTKAFVSSWGPRSTWWASAARLISRSIPSALDGRRNRSKTAQSQVAPVEVLVREPLYRWTNWKMLTKAHEYQKDDARTMHFPVRSSQGR